MLEELPRFLSSRYSGTPSPQNHMHKIIAAFLALLPLGASAQAPALWQDVKESSIAVTGDRTVRPTAYRTVRVNRDALAQLLAQAPMEFTEAAKNTTVVLSIPLPDGKMARFRIQRSPISAPNPDGKPSTFESYSGQGIDDPTATLRCDLSPAGFHAQILSAGESVYVDPFSADDPVNCISYYRRDARRPGAQPKCFVDFAKSFALPKTLESARPNAANGSVLRTVRSAFAATAEYTTFFRQAGDTDAQAKARALNAMKVTLNRVNGIWEKDAAIRYVLLPDATQLTIIYTDPNTDPYTNDNASTMSDENQASLDNVIGDANYDLGHVFATAPGGVGTAGVCVTGNKAKGVTGSATPVGDPFDVDFVAHEIIHQWDGNHTFNAGAGGECTAANRNAATAWEPGSGASLSSYAGICAEANLQRNSDDYFHGGSILEILNWLGNTATCAGQTVTGNTPPTVTAPASFTIPRSTPFTLTAVGNDPDGDILTYGWEEFDLGAASPPETDDGTRPILRPFKPTLSPSRTFPSLTYILNNANNPPATYTGTSATGTVCAANETCVTGEVLPSTTRTMNFRVQVRDNRAGGGGINDATTMVNVRADSGPFVVTSPNTAVSVGGAFPVTWDVANTNAAPVSAGNVKISLSTDGGMTFPTVLLASTPNDGSETVAVPNTPTATARIKVEAVGNIFFDVSDTNFTITHGTDPTPTPSPTPPGPTPAPTKLANISTRMLVQTGDNVLIGGFIVTGTQPKQVIVRAIGPSLNVNGTPLANRLQDTTLELFGPGGSIATNDNWRSTQEAAIIATTVPPQNDLESAIVATLPANSTGYTAIVRGAGGTSGVGLIEVFDLNRDTDSQLANISTRGFILTGDNVMIGGTILLGTSPRRLIVRAIGPSLNVNGVPVPGRLADSTLDLVNQNGVIVASNDNWRSTQEAEIIATTVPPPNDLEAAIVATLAPAPYTAIVRGKDGATGVGLVEVFALSD